MTWQELIVGIILIGCCAYAVLRICIYFRKCKSDDKCKGCAFKRECHKKKG